MQSKIVRIGSMNQAIGARRLLLRARIDTRVVKLEGVKDYDGCSYGIGIRERDLFDVARILRMNGISYRLDEADR